MKIDDIEIHVGEPNFDYHPIRPVEAKVEAVSNFARAPTMEDANSKLRELAAKLGANAIIKVDYKTGVSMTSWRSMKATGLAVQKEPDEIDCPVCAEKVKRAALKCRFCESEIPKTKPVKNAPSQMTALPPLTATNNSTVPYWIATAVIVVLFLVVLLASAGS